MVDAELPAAEIGQTLGLHLLAAEPAYALYQGHPTVAHLNVPGTIQGGWVAALIDCALGGAIHTAMPAGRGFTTVELNVKYTPALTPQVPPVRAEGRLIHCGRQLATSEARVFDASGMLYAHGTAPA